MPKISQRQQKILEFIGRKIRVGNKEIKEYLDSEFDQEISRVTIVRDLDNLLRAELIKKVGQGRSVSYSGLSANSLLGYFAVNEYFKRDIDDRQLKYNNFNFLVYKDLKDLFGSTELEKLQELNKKYQLRSKKLPPAIIKKEVERLIIELSWKSSQIEGNTYSLLDTEILIKDHREAKGHKKEEAIMILNHKKALDYIFSSKVSFKKLSLKQIENIHSLIVGDLGVKTGLRKNLVGITGTNYRPLDNQHQIIEAMQKMIKTINSVKSPITKALVANLMIAYIQPFADGNKRTSRLLANALLIANNYCPLSFRSINDGDYKKAVILFYEQNSALFFKELFIEQFKFSVNNYFK